MEATDPSLSFSLKTCFAADLLFFFLHHYCLEDSFLLGSCGRSGDLILPPSPFLIKISETPPFFSLPRRSRTIAIHRFYFSPFLLFFPFALPPGGRKDLHSTFFLPFSLPPPPRSARNLLDHSGFFPFLLFRHLGGPARRKRTAIRIFSRKILGNIEVGPRAILFPSFSSRWRAFVPRSSGEAGCAGPRPPPLFPSPPPSAGWPASGRARLAVSSIVVFISPPPFPFFPPHTVCCCLSFFFFSSSPH